MFEHRSDNRIKRLDPLRGELFIAGIDLGDSAQGGAAVAAGAVL